jgi:hypothetical protein
VRDGPTANDGSAGTRTISRNVSAQLPRLAVRVPEEAAGTLGVGVDYFNDHIRHELRVVRRGRLCFVSLREIERWLEANSARATG